MCRARASVNSSTKPRATALQCPNKRDTLLYGRIRLCARSDGAARCEAVHRFAFWFEARSADSGTCMPAIAAHERGVATHRVHCGCTARGLSLGARRRAIEQAGRPGESARGPHNRAGKPARAVVNTYGCVWTRRNGDAWRLAACVDARAHWPVSEPLDTVRGRAPPRHRSREGRPEAVCAGGGRAVLRSGRVETG